VVSFHPSTDDHLSALVDITAAFDRQPPQVSIQRQNTSPQAASLVDTHPLDPEDETPIADMLRQRGCQPIGEPQAHEPGRPAPDAHRSSTPVIASIR
jgi:hypothetical protein